MQVRPGRKPRGPDITDDLALLDRTPGLDALGKALHMTVQGLVPIAVLDDHRIAVAAAPAGQLDAAITRSLDGRASRGCIIHPLVGADLVQNRVLAPGREARADARKIHGCANEGLAQAVAIGRVVAGVALLVGITHGRVGFAAVGEARREDIAGADHFAVHHLLLIDHVELVTLANILGEIDVVSQHLGHVHGQAVGQPGALCRCGERALDDAMGVGSAHHGFADFTIEGVALGRLGQADGFQVADLAVQAGQLALLVQFELQDLAVLELAELLGLLAAGKNVVDGIGRQSDLGEQR